ncbi:MAG: AmmeMemoRadiSam system protein B [Pseudomonadales bacterium]|nr:AmmeMemoRadiSam system protein B [Pseudomonadales bacterium]
MIRAPAVAGTFYPADANVLRHQVESMLTRSGTQSIPVKALIVPHAGYIYSGQIAAKAYRLLEGNTKFKQIVLFGPAHYVYVEGLVVPSVSHFSTPLGQIPVDLKIIGGILDMPQVSVSNDAHAPEHSLEVQLPFLQMVLTDFNLIPVLVGNATTEQTAEVIERLWGDEETLLLISSDLSHFHSYAEALSIDRMTNEAICHRSENLKGEQACGCRAINGLMHCAKKRNLKVTPIGLCNSGDTAGDKKRVVGYGAYALY